jgi:hypothetical protein
MTSEREFNALLRAWFEESAPSGEPQGLLESVLTATAHTRPRPAWLVGLRGRPMPETGRPGLNRFAALALATTALVVAILIGVGMLVRAPNVGPSPVPGPTHSATPQPSTPPPAGLVAYQIVTRLEPGQRNCPKRSLSSCFESHTWLSNTDGSGAHRLFPDDFDAPILAWSPDGAHLLYQDQDGLMLTDPTGSQRTRLIPDAPCAYPCGDGFAWSPDGTRIAFVRGYANDANAGTGTVIAIVDIASGQVTELESTRTTNVSADQCSVSTHCEGVNETPRWSPDGSRLVFARQSMSPEPGSAWTSAAVYVVNPDGSDLRRVTPQGFYAFNASWSPNGSQLVFTNIEMIVNADHTSVTDMLSDIYTVRPDGADLRRLTDDGRSSATWTVDGRLAFTREIGFRDLDHPGWEYENWIMDADGGKLSKLGTSLAELTSAGCMRCMYPVPKNEHDVPSEALWQPTR